MSLLTVDTQVSVIVNSPLRLTDCVEILVEPHIIADETPDEDVPDSSASPPPDFHAPMCNPGLFRVPQSAPISFASGDTLFSSISP